MYGGSGTWPSASTASATVRPDGRSQAARVAGRETAAPGSRPRASRPLALEHHARAGLQLLAGMHERVPLLRAGLVLRPTGRCPSADTPPAPPLGTRRPMSRAGNTRVSFTTSRSPARRNSARWLKTLCVMAPDTAIEHEQAAGATRRRRPARSGRAGSSKSKSETFTRGRRRTCRGWCGLSPPGSASTDRRPLPVRSRTLSTRKSSMSAPASTSSHVSGIDTGGLRLRPDGVDARQRLSPRVLPIVHQHPAAGPDRLAVLDGQHLGVRGRPARSPAPW